MERAAQAIDLLDLFSSAEAIDALPITVTRLAELVADDGHDFRDIAEVDYLRSRVVVRGYANQSGIIDRTTRRSLDDRIDAQRFRDFGKRLAGMLELHDRRSRDHTDALHARQAFDQRFGHAVDEEVLPGVA